MLINGKEYETFIDDNGSERFKPNNLISKMRIQFNIIASDMVRLYELDAITQMELLDYYAGIGMSVCGVMELSFFENLFEEE